MMSTKKSNRWHSMQIEDVLRAFSTNRYKGLRSRDAIARKLKNGREPLWSTDPFEGAPSLFHQLCDYTTILFVLTVFLTVLFAHGAESVTVALLLVLSVGLRAFVIFATRKIVRQNARYRSPRCRVMRDGKCVYLFADQIVDGDIVLLSAGDTVPADVRLISGTLVTSEVYLDNSRRQVTKDAAELLRPDTAWEDRSNILFAASTVLSGDGIGVVVSTGERTLAYALGGRIALPKEEKCSTHQCVYSISRAVSLCMMVVCGIYLVIGIIAKRNPVPIDSLFLSAIALIVSSVSELLGILVYGAFANAMRRAETELSCVVKSVPVVEKLAEAEWLVIGDERHLLSGELFIHSWCNEKIQVHSREKNADIPRELSTICEAISSCFPKTETLTEEASSDRQSALQKTVRSLQAANQWRDVKSVGSCIESVLCNRMVTSLVAEGDAMYAYVCGAVEDVIACCSKVADIRGYRPITAGEVSAVRSFAHSCAHRAMKTIAVAKRLSPFNHLDRPSSVQNSMVFLGCIAVENPVDESVRDMVGYCREGGIRVAMLCDDLRSAEYIARRTGIVTDVDLVCEYDPRSIEEYMSAKEAGNMLLRSAHGRNTDVVREMQKHSQKIVYLGDHLTDLPIAKMCTAVYSERSNDRSMDVVSRRAGAVLTRSADVSAGNSSARSVLQALSICRSAVANISWIVIYLLLSQSLRSVLALFSLCMDMPLLSSSQVLLLGCVVDFLAVTAMVFRRNTSFALSLPRNRVQIPSWNTGLVAAAGIGVLSGLLLSLALLVDSRFFTLFDPSAVEILRLMGAVTCSLTAMHICAERSREPIGRRKTSVAYMAYIAFFAILVGALLYVCITRYSLTDWRVWISMFIPPIITGIMLVFYRNSQ